MGPDRVAILSLAAPLIDRRAAADQHMFVAARRSVWAALVLPDSEAERQIARLAEADVPAGEGWTLDEVHR